MTGLLVDTDQVLLDLWHERHDDDTDAAYRRALQSPTYLSGPGFAVEVVSHPAAGHVYASEDPQ